MGKEDVKKHLVAAFLSFLDREFESDSNDEQFRGLVDAARTSLSTAYDLPSDDSFMIPKEIEDIFFKEAKHHVKKPPVIKMDINEEKDNDEAYEEEDDDGNWKRRHRSKDDEEEKSSEMFEGNSDLKVEGSQDNIQENVEEDAIEDDLLPEEDNDLLVNV